MPLPFALLLQALPAQDTLLAPLQTPEPESLSLLDVLMKGGWSMIPILLLSVLAVYVFVERMLTLQRAKADPKRFTENVAAYVRSGDVAGAKSYCADRDSPIARIVRAGLDRLGRPIAEIEASVEAQGKHETFLLEKRTDLLASTAGIAPMLGFFGTVVGMISAFQQVQALEGSASPAALAEGIWEALVTTAAGLAVGIIALFAYNFLLARIRRLINDLERASTDFLDLLQTPS